MLARALMIAVAALGSPSCGEPSVHKAELDGYAGEAIVSRCLIRVDRRAWHWPRLCTTVAHELRHLKDYWNAAGFPYFWRGRWHRDHQHSPDRWSLMYPRYVRPWPRC